MHYHIRWSSGKLDWERYDSRAEAEAGGAIDPPRRDLPN
jgi:hypothetical protein